METRLPRKQTTAAKKAGATTITEKTATARTTMIQAQKQKIQ